MNLSVTDEELLERIRRDDPQAFELFVDHYGDRVYGFGVRVCGEREDARDVVQETLLQAFRSLKDLREPRALRSWLYRVASNACLMKRRKGKFEPARELSLEELMPRGNGGDLQVAADGIPPDEALARAELQREVRDAIESVPPHYRIVLVLRDMEQLSTREVSKAMGLPESTIKMRLHRARLAVRKFLEQRGRSRAGAEAPS